MEILSLVGVSGDNYTYQGTGYIATQQYNFICVVCSSVITDILVTYVNDDGIINISNSVETSEILEGVYQRLDITSRPKPILVGK